MYSWMETSSSSLEKYSEFMANFTDELYTCIPDEYRKLIDYVNAGTSFYLYDVANAMKNLAYALKTGDYSEALERNLEKMNAPRVEFQFSKPSSFEEFLRIVKEKLIPFLKDFDYYGWFDVLKSEGHLQDKSAYVTEYGVWGEFGDIDKFVERILKEILILELLYKKFPDCVKKAFSSV